MSTVTLGSITEAYGNGMEGDEELQNVSVRITDANLNRHKLTFRFTQPKIPNLRYHRVTDGDELDALDDDRVDAVREAARTIARKRWKRTGQEVAPNPRTHRDMYDE
jgi:hypothetical protein